MIILRPETFERIAGYSRLIPPGHNSLYAAVNLLSPTILLEIENYLDVPLRLAVLEITLA